jgi:hypothetical protein
MLKILKIKQKKMVTQKVFLSNLFSFFFCFTKKEIRLAAALSLFKISRIKRHSARQRSDSKVRCSAKILIVPEGQW